MEADTPRWGLIAHLRHQIAQDPEGYARPKEKATAERLLHPLYRIEVDTAHGTSITLRGRRRSDALREAAALLGDNPDATIVIAPDEVGG